MLRCMLHSTELGPEYWSYALQHAVYIRNRLPHHTIGITPYESLTGLKPDLSGLRIFGSRLYARKPGKRSAKLDSNTYKGYFLGFNATDKNVLYIDEDSGRIKSGTHVIFDCPLLHPILHSQPKLYNVWDTIPRRIGSLKSLKMISRTNF
jgi:hypothetical protein